MTQQEFLEELREVIDTEMILEAQTELDSIDTYDSIAVLSIMAWFDELGIKVAPKDFEGFVRVGDLLKKAEGILEA